MVMEKKVIYIEGTSDTDNGSLRMAFSKLLEKELRGKMPQVIMGDGKEQTIDKFLTKPLINNEHRYLLVDSDQPVNQDVKRSIVKEIGDRKVNIKQTATLDNVFLMVQEVEAWKLSQPKILNDIGLNTNAMPKCHPAEIHKPSTELSNIYRKAGKQYHKVSEFVRVFPMLNTQELKECFDEFRLLLDALK